MNKLLLLLALVLALVSCGDGSLLSEMERVKKCGDTDPVLAARMLDSLALDVEEARKYTRMKYELLKVRLNDRAGVQPTSDKMVRHIVEFFAEKGNAADRQEAFFYTGSVYRDLQDTPRALEYFFKSVDAAGGSGDCDSVLLRDAYSNLSYLYYNVQDGQDALDMAKKEYDLSHSLHDIPVNTVARLGNAYLATGDTVKAISCFREEMTAILRGGYDSNGLYALLLSFSDLGMVREASECMDAIRRRKVGREDSFAYNAIGAYYAMRGAVDSAALYYEKVMSLGRDGANMCEAAKRLQRYYSQKGDLQRADRYAGIFIRLTEELDLEKNQRLAATVSNRYKYHLDQRLMQKNEEDSMFYWRLSVFSIIAMAVLAFEFVVLYVRKRNSAQAELSRKEREQAGINGELRKIEERLHSAQLELDDKTRQSKSLLQMLSKAELADAAEDIVEHVKASASGKKPLSYSEWRKLFAAVDSLYPAFRQQILDNAGNVSEQQMCYLMKIGMKSFQIQNVMGLSRTTVWRWTSMCKWVYNV